MALNEIGSKDDTTRLRAVPTFESLDEAIFHADSLLMEGYERHGNWSLAQICCHLRLTIESNIDGYPVWMTVLGYPLRPLLKWLVLPKLLKGDSPKGIRTAGQFVPPEGLEDAEELQRFKECVTAFNTIQRGLHAHPGFGAMSKEGFGRFHAAHAAHHFGFLRFKSTCSNQDSK